MDITSFILGYKKGISSAGSGGATHPVHTVTFMTEDGAEVLYQRSVVDGDNCADVVVRGMLATPTKESSAQYNYTYSGWSLTSGGTASTSALSAVTEDRTVYAAYTGAVRYYTITYYDGDTVLKTESKAYGSTLSYAPEKDGYSFTGWSPELATVTGDSNYYAQWEEKVTFAGSSWADIARISEAGEARNYFKVGDTRVVEYNDGTNTYPITLAIVGFDHDDLADGSGKAGMTIFTFTTVDALNVSGTTYLVTNTTGVPAYYTAGTFFGRLPSEMRDVCKNVNKSYYKVQSYSQSTYTVSTRCFLPASPETDTYWADYVPGCTTYELFTTNALGFRQPYLYNQSGTKQKKYWIRNLDINSRAFSLSTTSSNRNNQTSMSSTSTSASVIIGFCI